MSFAGGFSVSPDSQFLVHRLSLEHLSNYTMANYVTGSVPVPPQDGHLVKLREGKKIDAIDDPVLTAPLPSQLGHCFDFVLFSF